MQEKILHHFHLIMALTNLVLPWANWG